MKKTSKILLVAALGALVFALALVGCGNSSNQKSSNSATSSSSATAAYKLVNDGKLTVATSPDFPPFENLDGDKYVGFDMELGSALAKKMNLEFNPITLQFDAIIPGIQAGGKADVGISGLTVDPDRAKQVDFTDSYYTDDMAVVAMKSNSDITKDNAKEACNKEGVSIAVQSGTTGEAYAKENFPNAKIIPFGNATDCFAKLQTNDVQVVCTNNAVACDTIKTAYQDAHIVMADATDEKYAMVVSKDNPELTKAINAALAELQKDGTIDQLKQKYFTE